MVRVQLCTGQTNYWEANSLPQSFVIHSFVILLPSPSCYRTVPLHYDCNLCITNLSILRHFQQVFGPSSWVSRLYTFFPLLFPFRFSYYWSPLVCSVIAFGFPRLAFLFPSVSPVYWSPSLLRSSLRLPPSTVSPVFSPWVHIIIPIFNIFRLTLLFSGLKIVISCLIDLVFKPLYVAVTYQTSLSAFPKTCFIFWK